MFQKGFYNPLFVTDGNYIRPLTDGQGLKLVSSDGLSSCLFKCYSSYFELTGLSYIVINPSSEIITNFGSSTSYVQKKANTGVAFFITSARGYSLVISSYDNKNISHDHPAQTNPTIFIHSITDPDIDNTQWLGLTHDQSNPVISWGTGELILKDGAGNNLTLTNAGALSDDIITQSQLKTTYGEVSWSDANFGSYNIESRISYNVSSLTYVTNIFLCPMGLAGSGGDLTLPGGEYGFYPQIKLDAVNTTAYAKQRYITASGRDYWTMLLIDKSTGQIKAGYAAADHPCYGNGGNINAVPHPWINNDISGQEVIILPLEETIRIIKEKGQDSILEHIHKNYKADITKEYTYKPMHSGLMKDKKPVMIDKLPEGIKVRKLTAK